MGIGYCLLTFSISLIHKQGPTIPVSISPFSQYFGRHAVLLILWIVLCAIPVVWAAPWIQFIGSDNPHLLQIASVHRVWEPYLLAQSYQQLSAAHFTPTAVTLYQAAVALGGVEPLGFLLLQVVFFGLTVLVLGWFAGYVAGTSSAIWIFIGLGLLGLNTWAPMLTRFYTLHYVFGALCTALAVWLLIAVRVRGFGVSVALLALAFALASKEVYVMVWPLLLGWALWQRRWRLSLTLVLLMAGYLIWRSHMIGFSLQGRSNVGYLADLLTVTPAQWVRFAQWFLNERIGLIILTGAALLARPRLFLGYLACVVPFALPVLAAPHGFRDPALHGDRLFFAFDLGWLTAVSIVLGRVWLEQARYQRAWLAGFVMLGVISTLIQLHRLEDFKQRIIATDEYWLSKELDHKLEGARAKGDWGPISHARTVVLVPSGYLISALWIDHPQLRFTAFCDEALQLTSDPKVRLLVPAPSDRAWRDTSHLAQDCKPFSAPPSIEILKPPMYQRGVLSWQLGVAEPTIEVGVAFPLRNLIIWAPGFEQRFVAPFANEPYHIVARKGPYWWRSSQQSMK
jgi:hypothetical protein